MRGSGLITYDLQYLSQKGDQCALVSESKTESAKKIVDRFYRAQYDNGKKGGYIFSVISADMAKISKELDRRNRLLIDVEEYASTMDVLYDDSSRLLYNELKNKTDRPSSAIKSFHKRQTYKIYGSANEEQTALHTVAEKKKPVFHRTGQGGVEFIYDDGLHLHFMGQDSERAVFSSYVFLEDHLAEKRETYDSLQSSIKKARRRTKLKVAAATVALTGLSLLGMYVEPVAAAGVGDWLTLPGQFWGAFGPWVYGSMFVAGGKAAGEQLGFATKKLTREMRDYAGAIKNIIPSALMWALGGFMAVAGMAAPELIPLMGLTMYLGYHKATRVEEYADIERRETNVKQNVEVGGKYKAAKTPGSAKSNTSQQAPQGEKSATEKLQESIDNMMEMQARIMQMDVTEKRMKLYDQMSRKMAEKATEASKAVESEPPAKPQTRGPGRPKKKQDA